MDSGGLVRLCGKSTGQMESGGFELRAVHPKPVDEHPLHQGGLLLLGVVGDFFEVEIVVVTVDSPGAHGQAELDISLDFACMGCAVEQPEFDRPLGKESVEIDTVVAGGVVVAVADTALITIVPRTVPDILGSIPTLSAIPFHCLE